MRAAVVRRYGAPEVFEYREWPEPALEPGKCLVRVKAIGINFADLLQRMGLYPGTPKPPFVPGFEVAGVVERAGEKSGCKPGDRVMAMTHFNGYVELAACPAAAVFPVPPKMTFEEAVAIPVNYLTAYHSMFEMGNLREGDRILVHGAAGGVGVAAVQLAKAHKLVVFGTAGPGKQEFLRQSGVDHPIDYTREDFVDAVHRAAPGGIEMVMDPIGGKSFANSYKCLGPMGRLIVYGFSAASNAAGKRSLVRGGTALLQTPSFKPLDMMSKNIAVIGVHMGRLDAKQAVMRREMGALLEMYAAGQIKPLVGKTFPLAQAADAHRYIHGRQNIGKVVLTVG
jgi:NADPH:quinone reductase-like Zn-dependent oxidoreductase